MFKLCWLGLVTVLILVPASLGQQEQLPWSLIVRSKNPSSPPFIYNGKSRGTITEAGKADVRFNYDLSGILNVISSLLLFLSLVPFFWLSQLRLI
jgi:hypothetical protein